jgi:hypothetical protein
MIDCGRSRAACDLRNPADAYSFVDMAKRPPPNRSTDAIVYVYCSKAEKAFLEAAAEKLVAGIPGAEIPLYKFVLQSALKRAEEALGYTLEQARPDGSKTEPLIIGRRT